MGTRSRSPRRLKARRTTFACGGVLLTALVQGGVHVLEITLRTDIQEVRRHAIALNEWTRDDIRLVADGIAHLTVKVDSLKR